LAPFIGRHNLATFNSLSLRLVRNTPRLSSLGRRIPGELNPYERVHSETPYRPDIDGLRAISIFAVVGFHSLPNVVSGGFVGVDVFFVISGYLISTIIFQAREQGQFSFLKFYGRRIRRIFPALFMVLTAVLCLGWFTLLADEFSQLGKHVAAASGFVLNFVLRTEAGYFDTAAELKPLLHLWSLAIEEQFYLLWPAFLALAFRRRGLAPALIMGLCLTSFGYNISRVFSAPVSAFYFPHSRLWELLIGALLAYATVSERTGYKYALALPDDHMRHRNVASTLGLLMIGIAIVRLDRQSAFPGWWALLPTIGAALIIAAGPKAWLNKCVLSARFLVFFGLISYPLYLWHWPLLSFARIYWSGAVPTGVIAGAVLLSIALAWATYRLFEIPIRLRPLNQIAVPLVAAMLVVGIAGYTIRADDGITSRAAAVAATDYDLSRLDAEHAAAIRSGRCHVNEPSQSEESLRSEIVSCLAVVSNKPNILIIGDSHAADIWLTLSRAYPQYNFLQATGAGCDPSQKASREFARHCLRLLNYIDTEFLNEKRVNGIILAARWRSTYDSILNDVDRYRAMGINVGLFGPTFEYIADVPKILVRKPDAVPAVAYLNARLDAQRFVLDEKMGRFSRQHGLPYFSVISLLCGDMTCPAVGPRGELYIRDYGHWTMDGVRDFGRLFAAERVMETLWPNPFSQSDR
jgi:peptidoglycan/LPS O-acetylase OafA/YrhL